MGLVGVDAPVALRQVFLQGQSAGVLFHQVAVGVPLAELADADVGDAEQAAERQHRRQHPLGQALIGSPPLCDPAVDQQPDEGKAEHSSVLAGILQDAQRPFLGAGILHRHQRKGQRGNDEPADVPGRAVQLDGGVFQCVDGHGGQDEHRHIEPPGVVAGIEGIEGAVQHRHQRKDGAGGNDPLFAVALPGAPVSQSTGQTAQGQVGGHARPLDDALRPDGGHIGRVGRQDPAQQDGKVLLGFRVSQKAPAGGQVDGAGVLQKREDRRPEDDGPQPYAEEALEGQMDEQPGRELEIPRADFTDKVEEQEEHLPHKEEVVVQQVDADPEREQPVPPMVDGLIQRPEHPREEGQNINEVVEEDVVKPPAGKGIEHRAQHGIVWVFHVAAQIQVCAAARHGELEHQQRDHEIGEPPLGEEQREPEERRAVQVEGIGVQRPAAQVGGPGEGVVDTACAVRVAQPLEKAVHVAVKTDLLAVEITGVVEKAAVQKIERQEDQRCRQRTQADREQEFVLFLPQKPGAVR